MAFQGTKPGHPRDTLSGLALWQISCVPEILHHFEVTDIFFFLKLSKLSRVWHSRLCLIAVWQWTYHAWWGVHEVVIQGQVCRGWSQIHHIAAKGRLLHLHLLHRIYRSIADGLSPQSHEFFFRHLVQQLLLLLQVKVLLYLAHKSILVIQINDISGSSIDDCIQFHVLSVGVFVAEIVIVLKIVVLVISSDSSHDSLIPLVPVGLFLGGKCCNLKLLLRRTVPSFHHSIKL